MSDSSKRFFDVIICGGGPSGIAAALATARNGADTLLIERYGFCGGNATAALVNPWLGHEYADPVSKREGSLTGGVFKEVVTELKQRGGYGSALTRSAFDEELLKNIYDNMLVEAGVNIRYHSYLNSVKIDECAVTSVEVLSKSGTEIFFANTFIDCTGDGDLAALAGVPFTVGRAADGLTQAMTVTFRMANVDKRDMIATGNLREARNLVEPYFQKALETGVLHYPFRTYIHFYDYPRPGILHFNMTRITKVSGLSVADLSFAETEGRRQAFLIGEWMIKYVPWFRDSYIEKIALQAGVRETRHIKGTYTMTREDIITARKFKDGIARSRYFIDIHNPAGAHDIQQKPGERGALKDGFAPPTGDYYEIPFRSMVNPKFPNLLIACRALSATHEASSAIRVMATMHGIGEAAGIAAAKAANQKIDVVSVEGEWVRGQIPYMSGGPDFAYPWDNS